MTLKPIRDPFQRARLMDLLRSGLTLKEAVTIMDTTGISLATIKEERKIDAEFDDAVTNAQAFVFAPVLRRIIALASEGDEDSDLTKTAMTLAVQHYNKALDREHDIHKTQAQQQLPAGTGTYMPTLTTPGQVAELMAALVTQANTIELDSEEVYEPEPEPERTYYPGTG